MMDIIKKISISSERVDQRRNKRYGLRMELTIFLGDKAAYCTRCESQDVQYDWNGVLEGLPHQASRNYGASSSWRTCETHGKNAAWMTHVPAVFWLGALRPKEILSESAAMRKIAQDAPENKDVGAWLTLEEILYARIQAVLAKHERGIEASQIAAQANRLVYAMVSQARDEAKRNTDFKTKLDALKAEFQAEQEACLASIIENELEPDCADSKEDWHPRAIELAAQMADGALAPAIRHFMMGGRDPVVKMEDVFSEEKTAIPA